MEYSDTYPLVERCFREEAASCQCACPFHLDIRGFLKKCAKGRWSAAYRDLSRAVLFPAVVGALCPQPCQGRCQRVSVGDGPLEMAALERAVAAFCADTPAETFSLPRKDKSVAVVGAGPAGLACALVLARKKFRVTVFEIAPGWGGHLREYSDFAVFEADFTKQFAGETVDWRFGTAAAEDTLAGFDAVYVAAGTGGSDFGLRESWNPENFTTARPGWFLGGGVTGMALMESIAAAGKLSQLLEAYLQTGRAALVVEQAGECAGHLLPHPGEPSRPTVRPADGAGYTKDEARAEAERCMQCTCDGCFSGCEMLRFYKKSPQKLAADIAGDSHTAPPFSNCEATRQTYSCSLCGLCADRCPEDVDLSKLFLLSRADRWRQDKWVPGIFDYWLRTLDFHDGDGFYAEPGRHDFLFFPGCQLSAVLPEATAAAWRFLRARCDTGIVLGCCGAPAIWAGDEDRAARNLTLLRGAWEAMGRPAVIAGCATCAEMLRRQIPEMQIVSLYEKLAELGAPRAKLPFAAAAVFDPCSARRDAAMHRAVVSLAAGSGAAVEELPGGQCCGHGGLIRLANEPLYDEIASNRAAQSAAPYVVYCANCLEVFRRQDKDAVHILAAVFPAEADTALPSLRQKRIRALSLKAAILQEAEGKTMEQKTEPWDGWMFRFPDEVLEAMERRLISEEDIREAVYTAETEQSYFTDETGLRTACLERRVLTFWADYRMTGADSVQVVSAYCHRMHLGGEEAGS